MGFPPSEVDRMSVWQFNACVTGYAAAHGGKKSSAGQDISEDRLRAMGIKGF